MSSDSVLEGNIFGIIYSKKDFMDLPKALPNFSFLSINNIITFYLFLMSFCYFINPSYSLLIITLFVKREIYCFFTR